MIAGYIESVGLPFPMVLGVLSMILEIVAGAALIVGYKTRYAALVLAVFALIATLFFHMDFSDMTQVGFFTKNLGIIGGLLYISTFGAGGYSIDANHATRKRGK
jgi:putative oxidoreductase